MLGQGGHHGQPRRNLKHVSTSANPHRIRLEIIKAQHNVLKIALRIRHQQALNAAAYGPHMHLHTR